MSASPSLPPAASAADDPVAFAAAVVAFDAAEAQRRRENRGPGPVDGRYIDTVYFLGTLRAPRSALRVLFDHPHVGTYMRRLAYYVLHTWRVQPAGVRITFDVFRLLYYFAPLRDEDINVAAIRYWFTELVTDPLAASLAEFDERGGLSFPIADVIREGFIYGDPPRAFSSWVWARRQLPVRPEDIHRAAFTFAHRPSLYLWEVLSHDSAVVRYMAERPHTEVAVTAMRGHRARRARRRLRVVFRAVWGAVTAWRLYQRWAMHPNRLIVATSALSLATASTRAAFADAASSSSSPAPRFSIAAAEQDE